jgi:hypothetical protein
MAASVIFNIPNICLLSVGRHNIMSILRNISSAIAGWKVQSYITYLEKYHQNCDYLIVNVFAPESIDLRKAEDELNNARKDLWLHYVNDHGGWGNNHKPNIICYNPDAHFIDEESLSFCMQNMKRIQNKELPVTNPLWLKNNFNGILRLHATIALDNTSSERTLNVSVSALSQQIIDGLDDLLTFPAEKSRCFFLYFKNNREWSVIKPPSDQIDNWQSWPSKSINCTGY